MVRSTIRNRSRAHNATPSGRPIRASIALAGLFAIAALPRIPSAVAVENAAAAVTSAAAAESSATVSNSMLTGEGAGKPYVLVTLDFPDNGDFDNATLTSVCAINSDGDIAGTIFDDDDDFYHGFVRRNTGSNGDWHRLNLSSNNNSTATDMNDDRNVVGYGTVSGNSNALVWVYDTDHYGNATTKGLGQAWGINNSNELVGYSTQLDSPVALLSLISTQPITLDPLAGDESSAARALNNAAEFPQIVGISVDEDSEPDERTIVIWQDDDGVPDAVGTGVYESAEPSAINDSAHIVGTDDTGPAVWLFVGSNTWSGPVAVPDRTNGDIARDINNSNEFITADKMYDVVPDVSYPYTSHSFTELLNTDLLWSPEDVDWGTLSLSSINDNGWIVGTIEYNGSNVIRIALLVPYDRNNNGTPDFREILADPGLDDDDDWVLDSTKQMRVGIYPPTMTPDAYDIQDVDGITTARWLMAYDDEIDDIVDQDGAGDFGDALAYLGSGDQPKEMVVMIRTVYGGDDQYDHIPETPTQQLLDLQCFAYNYAHAIDFLQFGNEIFGGPGVYYIESHVGLPGGATGILPTLPVSVLDEACTAVMAWMQKQVVVSVRSSALAGRPLEIITSAVTLGQVRVGYDGDLSISQVSWGTAERAAFGIDCVTDYGNRNHAPADIHLHYTDRDDLDPGIDEFLEGDSGTQNIWTPPAEITAMEWSMVPTEDWVTGLQETLEEYFENDEGTPEDEWEIFIDAWAFDTFDEMTIEDLIEDDLEILDLKGLRHACFGEFSQGGDEFDPDAVEKWDITTVLGNHILDPDPPYMLDTVPGKFTNVAVGLGTYAGLYLPNNFDPHPDEPPSSVDCD